MKELIGMLWLALQVAVINGVLRFTAWLKSCDRKDWLFGLCLFLFFIISTCFVAPVALVYYHDFLNWKPTGEFY
jgi:hypothetical protein